MKKRTTHNLLFVLCAIAFIAHQVLQKIFHISVPVVDSYLDPLLFMPIVLHLVVIERRIMLKVPDYRLPPTHIFGYFLLISILCEIILPFLNSEMIADKWDVLCYALGTLIYVVNTVNVPKGTEQGHNVHDHA